MHAMRLYLINPSNPLVSIVKVKESRWNRYRVWKPLSLMVLAGLTPPEWEISIVDENLGAPDYPAMPRPDLVGITAFTSQANRAYEVANHFRGLGVSVVMGGIHATMCLNEVLERVDSVVTGEAERVWPQVLEDARHGKLRCRYDGGLAEINDVPFARHDLPGEGYAFGAIQTTRGCPLNCPFCSVTAFNGARYRQRPIPDVVRELQSIPEKRVLVVDDNLIGTRPEHIARAKDLFHAMAQANLGKEWVAQATMNFADDEELLGLAAKAGCRGVRILRTGRASGARQEIQPSEGPRLPRLRTTHTETPHIGCGLFCHRFGYRRTGHRKTYRRQSQPARRGPSQRAVSDAITRHPPMGPMEIGGPHRPQ
jgi:hypothetical protein